MEAKPSCLSGSHNDIISANNWKCNRNINDSYVAVIFVTVYSVTNNTLRDAQKSQKDVISR